MVVYTCNEVLCAQSFHQEPAYLNHMRKHRESGSLPSDELADEIVNEGGEYLAVIGTKRKRKA